MITNTIYVSSLIVEQDNDLKRFGASDRTLCGFSSAFCNWFLYVSQIYVNHR